MVTWNGKRKRRMIPGWWTSKAQYIPEPILNYCRDRNRLCDRLNKEPRDGWNWLGKESESGERSPG